MKFVNIVLLHSMLCCQHFEFIGGSTLASLYIIFDLFLCLLVLEKSTSWGTQGSTVKIKGRYTKTWYPTYHQPPLLHIQESRQVQTRSHPSESYNQGASRPRITQYVAAVICGMSSNQTTVWESCSAVSGENDWSILISLWDQGLGRLILGEINDGFVVFLNCRLATLEIDHCCIGQGLLLTYYAAAVSYVGVIFIFKFASVVRVHLVLLLWLWNPS